MIKIRAMNWRRRRQVWFRQQTTTDRKRTIARLLLMLCALAVTNVISMVAFEDLSVWDSVWLTMTTMTTVGYGDISASSVPGRLTTILLMYVFGIFLLAQIAGEWIDFRIDRRDRMRKGLWRWNMQDHILIINAPRNGGRYLQILVEQILKTESLRDYPIQIFSPDFPDGLPSELAALGVVLHHGRPEGRDSFDDVDVSHASNIIIMSSDTDDPRADSVTLDILDQLQHVCVGAHIIAECVLDENRRRVLEHGAHAVIRPVRAYPELMVRALAAPGSEMILENLFQYEGVHAMRYDVDFAGKNWGRLAAGLLAQGLGTPLGFVDADGQLTLNPRIDTDVSGDALFLMVNHDRVADLADVARCVAATD